MRDKITPLCLPPLFYTPVWSGWWRIAAFSQISNMSLRRLAGAGALSRFPKVAEPLKSSHQANWEASCQELELLFHGGTKPSCRVSSRQPTYWGANGSTPRWGGLHSILHFLLENKTNKKENYHRGRKWKDIAAILQCCFVGMESPWTDALSTIKYSQHILVEE